MEDLVIPYLSLLLAKGWVSFAFPNNDLTSVIHSEQIKWNGSDLVISEDGSQTVIHAPHRTFTFRFISVHRNYDYSVVTLLERSQERSNRTQFSFCKKIENDLKMDISVKPSIQICVTFLRTSVLCFSLWQIFTHLFVARQWFEPKGSHPCP